ncbi:hypothetical protein ACFC90_04665 [Enterococcus casseliflavus]|uniref:hypothetical protein n=1 Tax=Enterococcus casseliflavus TaxID=37734 RepID=UPI0039A5DD91
MGWMDQLKANFSFSELTSLYQAYQKGDLDVKALLSNDFLQKYTDFQNLDEFMAKLGIQNENQIFDFLKDRPNRQKADQVVNEHSQFDSVISMMKKALQK